MTFENRKQSSHRRKNILRDSKSRERRVSDSNKYWGETNED